MRAHRNHIGKVVLLSFLFWNIGLSLSGQVMNGGSLSGTVIDSTTKDPIEYASVAVYKINNTAPVTGVITNNKGGFSIQNIQSGKYIVKINFMGYKAKSEYIEINSTSLKLEEPILLSSSTLYLAEVQVTGKVNEKQVSIEKTKINVAQNISAVSGNVIEVLKSQSSINIDVDNNIYLRGNSNILILMDGKPTTVTSLSSIPASNVENIEIVTNPDAKYDAEGTGGIINIITKKHNATGLNATLTLNYGINNRFNGGVGVNYKKGIWAMGLSYNGRYEESNITSSLSRQLYAQNKLIEQRIHSSLVSPTHVAALMFSVTPNTKNIISLNMKSMFPDVFNTQNINGTQTNSTLQETFFKRTNDVNWSRKTFESALSYKKIFQKNKHEVSFDAMFSRTNGSRPANYYNDNELIQKSDAGGAPTNITLQTDYLKQLFRTGRMELGLKAFSRQNNFNSHFYDKDTITNQWVINSAYSNDLEHEEYIYSSYLMYSDSLIKKVFYKVGVRVEYNTSELIQNSTNETLKTNYVFPFPFILVKYPISSIQNIALSLNRRVTRPTYPQLNPFIVVIDQLTYETGNKNLKPEITDKVEFNHSWIKEKLQLRSNLYYSTSKNFITQVSLLSSTNNLIVTYVNGNRQYKTGLDIDATYKFNKVFSVNPAFSLFYSRSNGQFNEIDLSTSGIAETANVKFAVKPNNKTEFQLFLNYNSPIDLPQFRLNEIYYADFAIKRSILKNKLSLSFTVTDIFDTRKWTISSENSVFKLYNTSKNDTRIFWFGITYNLNSFKSSNGQKNEGVESDGGLIKLGQ